MSALGQLLLLPCRGGNPRFLTISGLTTLVFALVIGSMLPPGAPAAAFLALYLLALYFLGMACGSTLAAVLVNDSLLLPYFARRLAQTGILVWLVVFGACAACLSVSGHATDIALAITLGTLVFACSIAAPLERVYFVPLLALVFGPQIAPKPQLAVLLTWLNSPSAIAAVVVAAIIVLWLVVGRRLRSTDPREAGSPMAIITSRWLANPSEPRHDRFGLGRLLRALFEGGADHTLQRAIAALQQRNTRWRRARLFRAVLLPYDNLIGVLLNTLAVGAGFVAVFLFMQLQGGAAGNGHVMAYLALILGRIRCTSIGKSFMQMRPHLADLYLATAPETHSAFQRRLFDTLATVIPIVVLHTLVGGLLIALILGDAHPGAMLASLAIAALGMGAIDLAVQLLGPRGQAVQFVVVMLTTLIYVAAYWLLYVACIWAGTPVGLLLTGVPILVAGGAVFWLARDSFAGQPPAFNPPLC